MALNTTNPTGTEAWKNLQNHYNAIHETTIQELFQEDNARVEKFNLQWNDFLIDYSKNNISQETVSLLLELANSIGLKEIEACKEKLPNYELRIIGNEDNNSVKIKLTKVNKND